MSQRQDLDVIRDLLKQVNKKTYQQCKKQVRKKGILIQDVQKKIPEKVTSAIEVVFYQAFKMIFSQGGKFIEKTYDKKKIELTHLGTDYHFRQTNDQKNFLGMKKAGADLSVKNKYFSALEGSVLGVLGIGIPDIPILLSTILRSIYVIAASYGFSYEDEKEQLYILRLIRLAMTETEEVYYLDGQLDQLAQTIGSNNLVSYDMEEEIKLTAKALTESMLVAKFIMTIPIVGIVGGLYNPYLLNRVNRMAQLKYEKRYLLKQVIDSAK